MVIVLSCDQDKKNLSKSSQERFYEEEQATYVFDHNTIIIGIVYDFLLYISCAPEATKFKDGFCRSSTIIDA